LKERGFKCQLSASLKGRGFKPRRRIAPKSRLYSLLKNSLLGGAALQALR